MTPTPGEHDDKGVHSWYDLTISFQSKGLRGDEYYGCRDNLPPEAEGNFDEYSLNLGSNEIQGIQCPFAI